MKNRTLIVTLLLVSVLGLAFLSTRTQATPFSDTFAGGVSGTLTRNQIPKVNGSSKLADSLLADDGTTVTDSGQLKVSLNPAGTTNTQAALLVNPTAAGTNELLAGLLVNGTSKFTVDAEGDTAAAGSVAIGGGAPILKTLTGTGSVDFTALAAGACENFTITVTGAVDGDPVFVGIPAAAWATTEYATINAFVSTTNTVTVKRCNLTNATTALSNPAAVTVRATVLQF